jgi:hypothetical protein
MLHTGTKHTLSIANSEGYFVGMGIFGAKVH